jgi:hypothetical protein
LPSEISSPDRQKLQQKAPGKDRKGIFGILGKVKNNLFAKGEENSAMADVEMNQNDMDLL